jgi:RimJ/RimL family protein N-acetyltransferase
VATALAAEKLAIHLGKREDVTSEDLAAALRDLTAHPEQVRSMSEACAARVDGRGAHRVARAFDASAIALRRAEPRDREAVYAWRNSEENRRYAHSSAPIAAATHDVWFERTLADRTRELLIAECAGEPVGVLRYDCAEQQSTVSIYLVPGMHGRGHGARVLLAGDEWLRTHRPEMKTLRAEVLSGNRASAAAFVEAGYRKRGEVYYKELS